MVRTNLNPYSRFTSKWLEGGFFLMQHGDPNQGGQKIKGIEYIEYNEKSKSLKSHYFENGGNLLEYMWEVGDNTLTIWFGEKGSPAFYKGRWSDDGNTNTGAWE